jgi:long-chain acyl-CoA synthetase
LRKHRRNQYIALGERERPVPRMSLQTLNDIFFTVVERNHRVVMMHRRDVHWVSISSEEFYQKVVGVAQALREWGIAKGDRVAILSENRPEWTVADFASLLIGAVTVPIYATLTAEQAAYILRDSGARAIFVSSPKQLAKVSSIREQTNLEHVVIMDADDTTTHAVSMQVLMHHGPKERDTDFDSLARGIQPGDLATIIYTSGTTGNPKGAMLTHGNMASNVTFSFKEFGVTQGDISISFLPLSHVTARHVDFLMLYHGVTLAYVSFQEHLPPALLEVRPTVFVGVPRMYEKIHTQVEHKAKGLKRLVYRWAMAVGGSHRNKVLAGQTPDSLAWKIADRLLYSKVRAGMGGRAQLFVSGGAPLGRELAQWYADIGIRIHEGYGLTETSPVIAVNTPKTHRLGTVGKPLGNVEVKIADDGEILVRGPSVFRGYWNKPKETSEVLSDGWFKTGDIGQLDADGFLSVTDRKKDLIKTSGGKFVAPQPLENSLKHNPLIAEAVVVGDKHKFPAVLIVPYFPLLEDWARSNQVAFSSREQLVNHPNVRALYAGIVADLNRNLARFEQLKRVLVIPEEFSAEHGTLTSSMKMRRHAVEERYRRQIEEMYAKAEEEGFVEKE